MQQGLFPEEMIKLPNWVVRKGKQPIDPHTCKNAKTNTPSTWSTFDYANTAVMIEDDIDGLGFVLNNEGLVFIDLDNCIDLPSGKMHATAEKIIETFSSYTEISMSGTGVHILMKGDIPDDGRKANKGILGFPIEMYKSGRYVALTGNIFNNNFTLTENQPALDELFTRIFGSARGPSVAVETSATANEKWLENALEKDQEFRELYEGRRDSDDESKCDYKLMLSLLLHATRDVNEAIAAFLSSPYAYSKDPYHQQKLKRPDYLKRTAKNALKELNIDELFSGIDEGIVDEWAEPKGLDLPTPMAFNPAWLPEPLETFCREGAESLQVPTDFFGIGLLGVLALCNAKVYRIEGKPDHVEPLNLMCIISAEPSERKSAVISNLMNPILKYEDSINTFLKEDVALYENEKAILDKRLRTLQEKASKDPKAKLEAEEVVKQMANLTPVYRKRYYISDATPEKIISIMEEQNGRIAVIGAEGGFLDLINGQYSKFPMFDFLLNGFSGETITVDRVGRPSVIIHNSSISILLAVQPSVVGGMISNEKFVSKGLLSRMIIVFPESNIGKRTYEVPPISSHIRDQYHGLIIKLISKNPDNSKVLNLSSQAAVEYSNHFTSIESRMNGDLSNLGGLGGKLHGLTLRIAANLHVATYPENAQEILVSIDTIRIAIEISEYIINHAQRVYAASIHSSFNQGRYMIKRIITNWPDSGIITRREISRLCQSIHPSELDNIINTLIDYNYLRPLKAESQVGRPSTKFSINPFLDPNRNVRQENYSTTN